MMQEPGDTPAASDSGGYLHYDLLGFVGNSAVYRGSDGQYYTDGPGMNGFVPWTGDTSKFTQTPNGTGPADQPPPTPTPTPTPPPTTDTGGGAPPPPSLPSGMSYADMLNAAGQYYRGKYGSSLSDALVTQMKGDLGSSADPSYRYNDQDLQNVRNWINAHPPGTGGTGGTTGGGTGGGAGSATGIANNPPTFGGPGYTPPPAFTYANFSAPTADDVYSDPSFQLRFGMGQQALENSKAAQGVLGTGGTIKDFINYGQNFASQEYKNIFDRSLQTYAANRQNALDTYNTNYGTQYTDPFQFAFQNAQATLQPQELAYTTQVGAAQHATDQSQLYDFNNRVFDWNSAFQQAQADYTKQRNTQLDSFDQWYRKMLLDMQAAA